MNLSQKMRQRREIGHLPRLRRKQNQTVKVAVNFDMIFFFLINELL